MKKIQNGAAFVFIASVVILTVISICGVWKVFDVDVITKSIQTFGLLSVVAVIVMIAGKFVDSRDQLTVSSTGAVEDVPFSNLAFTTIRKITLAVLIASVSILALLGVLAIWDVLSGEVLNKSISSIIVVAFATLIVIMTCLQREQLFKNNKTSLGKVILYIILALIGLPFVVGIFQALFHNY
ncbi:MAG: hypothetical protein WCG28_01990 [bacterium]